MSFKQYTISIDFSNDANEDCLHQEIIDADPIPSAGFLGVVKGANIADGLQVHYTAGSLLPAEETALDIIIAAHDPDNCPTPLPPESGESSIPESEKGNPGGVPELGEDGYVPESQLPPQAFAHVFHVADATERFALDAYTGDEAIQTDDDSQWILDSYSVWIARESGITAGHKNLDILVHNLSEDAFEEFTRSGNKVINITVWTNFNKILKIRETDFTYIGNRVSIETIKQYDVLGILIQTLTGTYSYTGNKIDNIDWSET